MSTLLQSIGEFFKKLHSAEVSLPKINFLASRVSRKNEQEHSGPFVSEPSAEMRHKTAFKLPKGFGPDLRMGEIGRYFSGSVFEKALVTIDKSTLVIMGVAWVVAIITMGLAFVAVRETAQLKLKTEVARALDPVLPKIVRLALTKEQYEPLIARLKKQFPTITIEITGKPTLRLQSNNPEEFMTWLNAVSYVDSMISTVRWTMTTFCVGTECPGDGLMQAELTAEAINITQPENLAP